MATVLDRHARAGPMADGPAAVRGGEVLSSTTMNGGGDAHGPSGGGVAATDAGFVERKHSGGSAPSVSAWQPPALDTALAGGSRHSASFSAGDGSVHSATRQAGHSATPAARAFHAQDATPMALLAAPPTHFPPLVAEEDEQGSGSSTGSQSGSGDEEGSGVGGGDEVGAGGATVQRDGGATSRSASHDAGDGDDSGTGGGASTTRSSGRRRRGSHTSPRHRRGSDSEPIARTYFNLTSVLADPRLPDRPPLLADMLYGEAPYTPPPPPVSLPSVTLGDFGPFIESLRQAAGRVRVPSFRGDVVSGAVVNAADAHQQCYSVVPADFFHPRFSLSNPDAFDKYLCVQASLAQQNKLSHYLDLVEVDLLRHIGQRSNDFFTALSTFQELQRVVTLAVGDVALLRKRIRGIKQRLARRSLKMLANQRRCHALKRVHAIAKRIAGIPKARALVVRMVQAKDYGGALAVVDRTLDVLSSELKGVRCVEQIKEELFRYRRLIANTLTQSFRDTAVGLVIVGQRGAEPAPVAPLQDDAGGSGWTDADAVRFEEQLDLYIRPQIAGLLRVNGLREAVSQYRAKLKAEVKNTVRSVVNQTIECLANPADGTVAATERTVSTALLRKLTTVQFSRVMTVLMDSLCVLARRANALHELIQTALDVAGSSQGDTTTSGRSTVFSALRSELVQHQRIMMLMQAPSSPVLECPVWTKRDVVQSARSFSKTALALLSAELWQWCRERDRLPELARWIKQLPEVTPEETSFGDRILAAALGAPRGVGGAAVGAATGGPDSVAATRRASADVVALVSDVAQKHVEKILRTRRDGNKRLRVPELCELWDSVYDFSQRMDAISHKPVFHLRNEMMHQAREALNFLYSTHHTSLGSFLDREDWRAAEVNSVFQCIADILCGVKPPGSLPAAIASARASSGTPRRELVVAEQPYTVAFAALKLLEMLEKHVSSAARMPPVSATVVGQVVALLREFNKRTDQLLLKARARQLQTLRTITARHLAMASQCLGLIVSLLPAMRSLLMVGLPPDQHVLLDDFAAVTRDYNTHIDRILNKFVGLIRDGAAARLRGIENIRWDEPGPTPSRAAEDLIKDVSMLHKVLQPRLRPAQTTEVFSRVAVMLAETLPTLISRVPIHTLSNTGKERLSADVRHIILQLRGLRALRDPSSSLSVSLGVGAGGGHHDQASADASSPGASHAPGSLVRGQAAIRSLEDWLNRTFSDGSRPPVPPTRSVPPASPVASASSAPNPPAGGQSGHDVAAAGGSAGSSGGAADDASEPAMIVAESGDEGEDGDLAPAAADLGEGGGNDGATGVDAPDDAGDVGHVVGDHGELATAPV